MSYYGSRSISPGYGSLFELDKCTIAADTAIYDIRDTDDGLVLTVLKGLTAEDTRNQKDPFAIFGFTQAVKSVEVNLSKFKPILVKDVAVTKEFDALPKQLYYNSDVLSSTPISKITKYAMKDMVLYAVYGLDGIEYPKAILATATAAGLDPAEANFLVLELSCSGYRNGRRGTCRTNSRVAIGISRECKSHDLLLTTEQYYIKEHRKTILELQKFWTKGIKQVKDITIEHCNLAITSTKIRIYLQHYIITVPKNKLSIILKRIAKQLPRAKNRSAEQLVFEFISDLSLPDTTLEDKLCVVNGIPMSTETQHNFSYVNCQRINAADVVDCVAHIPRMLGDAVKYQQFLKSAGKVSLEVQRYIEQGFVFNTGLTESTLDKIGKLKAFTLAKELEPYDIANMGEGQSGFNFMSDSHGSNVSIKLPIGFNKVYGKPAEIEFLGAWYPLDNTIQYFKNNALSSGGNGYSAFAGTYTSTIVNFMESSSYTDTTGVLAKVQPSLYAIIGNIKRLHSCLATPLIENLDNFESQETKVAVCDAILRIAGRYSTLYEGTSRFGTEAIVATVTKLTAMVASTDKIQYMYNSDKKINGFRVVGTSNAVYYVNLAGGVFAKPSFNGYICIDPYGGHGNSNLLGFEYTLSILSILVSDLKVKDKIGNVKSAIDGLCEIEKTTAKTAGN